MPENCETNDLVLHRCMLLPEYVVFWRYIKIQKILLKKSEIILFLLIFRTHIYGTLVL